MCFLPSLSISICLSHISLLSSLTPSLHLLVFLPFRMLSYLEYPTFSFFVFLCLSSLCFTSIGLCLLSFSSLGPVIPSHTDHIHMLIIKSPPAPPHLWGNPLAGHRCLSDKEQYRCFMPLLFLPLWLFLHDFRTTAYVWSKNLAWPSWNRRGLCVIQPATAAAFNEPEPD